MEGSSWVMEHTCSIQAPGRDCKSVHLRLDHVSVITAFEVIIGECELEPDSTSPEDRLLRAWLQGREGGGK